MADKKDEQPAAEAPKEEKKNDAAGADGAAAGGNGKPVVEAGFIHKKIIDTRKELGIIYLNSTKEKEYLEQMRRWRVVIKEIYITPLEEMFDPFIQFTIGGDFGVEVFINTKKNKKIKKVNGERGFSDKTEVLRDCNVGQRYRFEKEIESEIRDNIINLMKQNILVEVWDWDGWSLNNLDGFYLFDIFALIKGNICQSCIIEKNYGEKLKKPHAKVEFKIVFQEIWDFVLSFEDWAASNVNSLFPNVASSEINAGISFQLSDDIFAIENKDFKKGANPEWSNFTGEIQFRGTLNDLETQRLKITIENCGQFNINLGIGNSKPNTTTDLKGISVDGLIKAYIVGAEVSNEDDLETMIRGKISVNALPTYNQQGLDSIIVEDEIYLIIRIGKISNFNTPNFVKLPVSVYITVEWNGKTYETRKIPIQLEKKFDQELNFLFGEDKNVCNKIILDRTNIIRKNLKSKNDVCVKLWVEDSYRCQDFLGQFEFYLIDIFEKGIKDMREFKRDESIIPYYTRVLKDRSQFESSYTKQENFVLDYEAWFYPSSFTNAVELTQDLIKKSQKVNPINLQVESIIKENEDVIKKKLFDLTMNFELYRSRYFTFNSYDDEETAMKVNGNKINLYYVVDQIGQIRFINSYLSKLTIKGFNLNMNSYNDEIKKILDDKEFLPKLRLPINTLDSLLHYVKCIRYTSNQNDEYLLSPDCFMLNRKGSKYEHAIFLACLMMNMYSNKYTVPDSDDEDEEEKQQKEKKQNEVKKDNYSKLEDIKEEDNKLEIADEKKDEINKTQDASNRSVDPLFKEGQEKKEEIKVENNIEANSPIVKKNPKKPKVPKPKGAKFDTSDLVFICMGKLKHSDDSSSNSANHFWVMTIDVNFKDIEFWDAINCKHYSLCDRIEFPDIMKTFMKGEIDSLQQIHDLIKKRTAKNKLVGNNMDNDTKKKATKSRLAKQLTENDEIDGQLIIEKPQVLLNDIDYMEQHTNVKLGTKFENLVGNGKVDEEFLIHNNLVKKKNVGGDQEHDDKKQKNMAKDFEWKREYSNRKKKVKNDILPYKTIDIVFNKKNIWINLQNPDPVRILYDLYNNQRWMSVLKTRNDAGKEMIWKNDIPTFYSFRNFASFYTEDEMEATKKSILKAVNEAIRSTRMIKNLSTKFKRASKDFSDMLDLYLVFLEFKALGADPKEVFQKRIENWKQYLLSILPNKTRFTMLPLFFNYSYDNTISTYINDYCTDFLYHVKKNATFTTTCKIFQYPNRIFSVRVLITIMYKVTKEEMDESEYNEEWVFQTEKVDEKEMKKYQDEVERMKIIENQKKD